MDPSVFADRLRSKESVYLGHNVKKVAQKTMQALASQSPIASAAALREIKLYELEIAKAEQSGESCAEQLKDYAVLDAQVNKKVESTQAEIETLTAELHTAKIARQHKEQYEALAKLVNAHSSKPKTKAEQAALEEELSKLKQEKASLDERVAIRRKQFKLMMAAIHDMTRTLAEDPFEEQSAPEATTPGSGRRVRGEGGGEEGEEDEEEDDAGETTRSKRQKK